MVSKNMKISNVVLSVNGYRMYTEVYRVGDVHQKIDSMG